jgi:hypothetical protein
MADTPPPPASPKKHLATPAKGAPTSARVAASTHGETFSANDLATLSSGPIGNKASVEKDVSREDAKRQKRISARNKATQKDLSRPYTTTRSLSR